MVQKDFAGTGRFSTYMLVPSTSVGSVTRNLVVTPCTAQLQARRPREQSESEYNVMKGRLPLSPLPHGWERHNAGNGSGVLALRCRSPTHSYMSKSDVDGGPLARKNG
ncbi:hypothetical protein PISMIDRAFT_6918 [Pisolithus microcarpus 441]|uniref:Uncharacterized protein n=1 Tax=Pisolithus microcarpus 441 TaxID=765257 RepID=A0A0C9ZSP6_9AGAM|nr:hypothetical protein BKA83DRAFT_6918 [Pisolithus microcarpus]KIK29009.1 hypothetical protein PISMIDRAFT_6918 [Pisolithus microcarpus 441]